ncbi:33925_t:CDS:2, partial [Gigaspora margarita]
QSTSDQFIKKNPDVGKAVPKIFSDAPNIEIKPCDLCFVFKNELVKVCPGAEKDR